MTHLRGAVLPLFLLISAPLSAQTLESDRGWDIFDGNERHTVSKGDDPAKVRVGAPAGKTVGCFSGDRTHPTDPLDAHTLAEICIGVPDDDDPAFPSGGGQLVISVQRKGVSGDAGMMRMIVISPAYQPDGIPRVWIYPNLGPFAQGVTTAYVPPPPVVLPPPPLGSIAVGDFVALQAHYGFPSDDQYDYLTGRVTWGQVIANMQWRARPQ